MRTFGDRVRKAVKDSRIKSTFLLHNSDASNTTTFIAVNVPETCVCVRACMLHTAICGHTHRYIYEREPNNYSHA